MAAFEVGVGEDAGAGFNEARHHVEDRDAGPEAAIAGAEAFFVEVADDAGVRKVLGEEVHHLHKDLVLGGVDFQTRTVVGDAETVGDVVGEGTRGGGFVGRKLSAPLEREKLPAGGEALIDDAGAEGAGDDVADAFEVGHGGDLLVRLRREDAIVPPIHLGREVADEIDPRSCKSLRREIYTVRF